MKKKYLMHKFSKVFAVMLLSAALALGGCTSANAPEGTTDAAASQTESSVQAGQTTYSAAASAGVVTTIDITDMFSKRDMETEYQEEECVLITLNGTEAQCSSSGVTIEDGTVIIKEAGSYLLRGSFNGSIRVEAPEDAKVQVILDGVTLRQSGTAAIYGKTADKIFLTMAEGSSNQIINEGDFQ
ncbi:MAG: carbohydrate-binding domain-containing protein, partial [Lachnospiraceae bacterium]|nr:carbohydrate-binding domain-containing protein [Lachnospiraceae bacterium]